MEALYEKNTNGNILYIRHGQTYYNQSEKLYIKHELNTNPDFLDCQLNDYGRKQAEEAQQTINKLNIKYVFSSPLLRCLETTHHALKTHPNKRAIVVLVHPLVTEIVNGVQDYNVSIEEKKKQFNMETEIKFDWSYFDAAFPDPRHREIYFLEFTDNVKPEEEIALNEIILDLLKASSKEKLVRFAKFFYTPEHEKRPETIKSVHNRGLKFKKYLREFLKDNLLKDDEKILVFSHSSFIMVSNSEKAYSIGYDVSEYPDDCFKPKNLEMLSVNIYK
jgi:broad specificity phosphatase PhoE